MSRWYMSFATEDEFLGGIVTDADSFIDAVSKARRMGINPGGEVLGVNIDGAIIDESMMDQLLTKDEAETMAGHVEETT